MSEIIKACPHCGGESSPVSMICRNRNGYKIFVHCEICGARGKHYHSDRDINEQLDDDIINKAITAWNMRQCERGESEND